MMRCPYCFENGEDKTCRRCGRETEEMMDELKPCPFCGSSKSTIEPVFGASFGTPRFCVICSDCGADSQVDLGLSGATECWNTRPIEDELRARVAELEVKLSGAGDEVMEIIAAALSGDCQKYLNYDLDGNRYCKWGIVEKDIRAIFKKGGE